MKRTRSLLMMFTFTMMLSGGCSTIDAVYCLSKENLARGVKLRSHQPIGSHFAVAWHAQYYHDWGQWAPLGSSYQDGVAVFDIGSDLPLVEQPCTVDFYGTPQPLSAKYGGWISIVPDFYSIKRRDLIYDKGMLAGTTEKNISDIIRDADCSVVIALVSKPVSSGPRDVALVLYSPDLNEVGRFDIPRDQRLASSDKWLYLAVSPVLSVLDIPVVILEFISFVRNPL